MKKKFWLISLSFILIIILVIVTFLPIKSTMNSKIVSNLEGQLFYLKRVDGVNTLFKSDANLQNEQLLYSHKGKGKDGYGSYNDNIIDFYFDRKNKTISFIAMNNGNWSMFSLTEGNDHPFLIEKADFLPKTDYIKDSTEKLTVTQKKGSLYITENSKEKRIKKFYGAYDQKFTGYSPIGFSPDGNYLIYHSMEHLTSIGTILQGMVTDSYGHYYIMDLRTGKSTRFIDASNFQWINNN